MAYTPMILQYLEVKKQYEDCILFFRLGDFYEMFFEDAITASKDMDVVLTSKACGDGEKAPMCGVPYHSVDVYLSRLLEKGHKVAIAEQMEDPAEAKGIVAREVIRVVTPGTVISQDMLDEKKNNFLACVYMADEAAGLAWCDVSTGEFSATQLSGPSLADQLLGQLARISPKEIITNADRSAAPGLWELADGSEEIFISVPREALFSDRSCSERICAHFGTVSPRSMGLSQEDDPMLFYSVGALLGYLIDTQKQEAVHLGELSIRDGRSVMSLDRATIRNLEITETIYDRKVQGSLLGILDRCGTAMGSRRMKQWLREPLNELDAIKRRLDSVEALADDVLLRNDLRSALRSIYDLERLSGRLALGSANARDLIALKQSLECIPEVKAALQSSGDPLLLELDGDIDPLEELRAEIDAAINDDPPFTVREGGMIKPGYSGELDGLIDSIKNAKDWIASLEGKERERTGIKNLRVGFNKVFGYYIEVSNSNKDNVPDDYVRKQTLVGGERFITSEMKEMEGIVLNAQLKINDLEYRLFTALRLKAMDLIPSLKKSSSAIAECDVLASFAESSVKLGYVKPEVNGGDEIIIRKGRHPVIETSIKDGVYVSNDVYIDRSDSSMLLITGPNMSGKSTYMRQLALIVLMAQAGCFVPAESASIGICDRIYTRIGASDNLAMGQSTFFVEMSELAYILNTATPKSLVILDEIGRGTSTYDGLSIAWAAVEFLTAERRMIRTLFATHYHELTALAGSVRGVVNLNVDVTEENGNIVFLHKIVQGSASRSYGIHVAKLAGVPKELLDSAQSRLEQLERSAGELPAENETKSAAPDGGEQLSMFSPQDSVLASMVRSIDLMNITPSGAIAVLEELQKAAKATGDKK